MIGWYSVGQYDVLIKNLRELGDICKLVSQLYEAAWGYIAWTLLPKYLKAWTGNHITAKAASVILINKSLKKDKLVYNGLRSSIQTNIDNPHLLSWNVHFRNGVR